MRSEPPRPERAVTFGPHPISRYRQRDRQRRRTLTPPLGFGVSGARKQDSEPRRLAAESSPSLNGEGSTIRRTTFEPA